MIQKSNTHFDKLIEYIEGEIPQVLHFNSSKAEWWELYKKTDSQDYYIKFSYFHKGSGLMNKHHHTRFQEVFKVVEGTATYHIDGKRYIAHKGDEIVIPVGIYHTNPYNSSIHPLVMVQLNPDSKLVEFYQYYYSQIEKEKYINNRGGLPDNSQQIQLNELFGDTIMYEVQDGYYQFVKSVKSLFSKK